VFPSFLWIVGVAMTLSLAKRVAAGAPRSKLFVQVLRRAAILYLLGLVLYGFPKYDLSTLRLLGVLQRIAICYAIAAAIYLTTSIRGQIAWIAGLLASYWMLMTLVPVPGYGAGRLDVEGNLAHYVDRIVLGAHNYNETKTWDPEGIVSTLPSIATALFGVMAGHLLRLRRDLAERTTWLFLAGNLLLAAALIADHWMPINKKLWTSSFSLFMAGLDFVLFAMFVWIVDGLGWRRPVRPLVVLGMNAIAVYMASEMVEAVLWSFGWRQPLYRAVFAPLPMSPYNTSLAFSLALLAVMFALAYLLHRRRWILRV
jgi:predicted acyltransferase